MDPAASPLRSRSRRSAGGLSPEDKLVASLIRLMQAGTTPWRRPWDGSASGGHHVNLLSGRRYRGVNPALLCLGMHSRGSALPYWCGYSEARALGISPRKGSQAVHILRPQLHRTSGSDPATGGAGASEGAGPPAGERCGGSVEQEPLSGAAARQWVSYKPVPVFNAGDLEGEALSALIEQRRQQAGASSRSEPERLAQAEAVLSGWEVPISHGGDQACYLPQSDRIQLPDRSAFHSAAGLYATWAHEAIHSTGHASRLARDLSGAFGSRAYAREELVAELGAVLLGDRLRIGSEACHHAAYLSSWIALLQESPRLLFQVLSEARRAAELICPEEPEEAAPALNRCAISN